MTTTGCTTHQLMACPLCGALNTATINVTTDTQGAHITGGIILGTLPCDGCANTLRMLIPVSNHTP